MYEHRMSKKVLRVNNKHPGRKAATTEAVDNNQCYG